MRYLVAAPIVVGALALALAALRGQARARSCCPPADPRRDLRMRTATADQPAVED